MTPPTTSFNQASSVSLSRTRLEENDRSLDDSQIPMCRADSEHPNRPDSSVHIGAQQFLVDPADNGSSRIIFQPDLEAGANQSQRSPNARERYLILRDGRYIFSNHLETDQVPRFLPNGTQIARMLELQAIREGSNAREWNEQERAEVTRLREEIDEELLAEITPALAGHGSQGFSVCRLPVSSNTTAPAQSSNESDAGTDGGTNGGTNGDTQRFNYFVSLYDRRFANMCEGEVRQGMTRRDGYGTEDPGGNITPVEWVNLQELFLRNDPNAARIGENRYCFADSTIGGNTLRPERGRIELSGQLQQRTGPRRLIDLITFMTGQGGINQESTFPPVASHHVEGYFTGARVEAMASSLHGFIVDHLEQQGRYERQEELSNTQDDRQGTQLIIGIIGSVLGAAGFLVSVFMLKQFRRMMALSERQMALAEGKDDKPVLQEIGDNLTERARSGEFTEVHDRSTIEVVERAESRFQKTRGANSFVVVAPAGWGKDVVMQQLAMRNPGTTFIMTSGTDLMSGTMYRGSLEKRIANIPREVEDMRSRGLMPVIMIDELHETMLQRESSGMDSNGKVLLEPWKPALARGARSRGLTIGGFSTPAEWAQVEEVSRTTNQRLRPLLKRFAVIRAPGRPQTEIESLIRTVTENVAREDGRQIRLTDGAVRRIAEASLSDNPSEGHIPRTALDDILFELIDRESEGNIEIKEKDVERFLAENAADAETRADATSNAEASQGEQPGTPRESAREAEAPAETGNATADARTAIGQETIRGIGSDVAREFSSEGRRVFSADVNTFVFETVTEEARESNLTLEQQRSMTTTLYRSIAEQAPTDARIIRLRSNPDGSGTHFGEAAIDAWAARAQQTTARISQVRSFLTDASTPEVVRNAFSGQNSMPGVQDVLVREMVAAWDAAETRSGEPMPEIPRAVLYDQMESQGLITSEQRATLEGATATPSPDAPAPVRGQGSGSGSQGRTDATPRSADPDAPAPVRGRGATTGRSAPVTMTEASLMEHFRGLDSRLGNSQYDPMMREMARDALALYERLEVPADATSLEARALRTAVVEQVAEEHARRLAERSERPMVRAGERMGRGLERDREGRSSEFAEAIRRAREGAIRHATHR